jgi:hypothetical protein
MSEVFAPDRRPSWSTLMLRCPETERAPDHVAPGAGGVPDAQQDRYVAAPRLGKRLGAPLPPVHRLSLCCSR